MITETKKTNKKVSISAKIPKEIKSQILKIAEDEDRTASQVLTRLLLSHPELKSNTSLALQS